MWFERAASHGLKASEPHLLRLAAEGIPAARAALRRLNIDVPLHATAAGIIAAGGCPLGNVTAQEVCVRRWFEEPSIDAVCAAAEGGDLAAQYVLAVRIRDGHGGAPRDSALMLKWLRRAAAGNVARAQVDLGVMHMHGQGGLAVNIAAAVQLYKAAAAQEHNVALNNLAKCFLQGWGVSRDPAEAVRLFRASADKGYADSEGHLARAYFSGDGIERNVEESQRWARLAANQGDSLGELLLGVMYRHGIGVEPDLHEAALWFARSEEHCPSGRDLGTGKELCALAAEGVPEAVAAVQRLLPLDK